VGLGYLVMVANKMETKRSGKLNQYLTRLALFALAHRRFVLPCTVERLKATSSFDGEFGAEAKSMVVIEIASYH
jgi:hypothetical protein